MTDPLSDLISVWRKRAVELEEYAAPAATAFWRAAEELEDAVAAQSMQPLTPKEAAEEGGYTEDYIREFLRDNPSLNAGRPGAPRILRAHVPVKPGHRTVAPQSSAAQSATPGARARREARRLRKG
jgi:hypothetical protein